MMVKVAISAALLTAFGLGYALIQAEQSAPLAEKPSIRLRVWSGDLPTADLARVLAEETARIEAAKATRDQAVLAAAAQRQVTQVGVELLQKLEARIAEKQATDWAGTLPSPPR